MYRHFEIEDFRGISNLKLRDLGRINVLTGLNDSGKTSALEAIFLHASGPLAGTTAIQTLRMGRKQDQFSFGAEGEDPWLGLFRDFDRSRPVRLQGERNGSTYSVSLEAASPSEMKPNVSPTSTGGTQAAQLAAIAVITQLGRNKAQRFVQVMALRVSAQGGGARPTDFSVDFELTPQPDGPFVLASIVKGNVGADLATGFSNMKRSSAASDFIEAIREVDSRIENVEVLLQNGRALLHAKIGETLVPFDLLGDGTFAVAQYLVSMSNAKNGVLLIDEIGNGVHYSVLPKMWNAIYRAAKRHDVQVFATTHSRETLVAASEVIRDRVDDLQLYRIRRPQEIGSDSEVTQYYGETLEAALEMNAEVR